MLTAAATAASGRQQDEKGREQGGNETNEKVVVDRNLRFPPGSVGDTYIEAPSLEALYLAFWQPLAPNSLPSG